MKEKMTEQEWEEICSENARECARCGHVYGDHGKGGCLRGVIPHRSPNTPPCTCGSFVETTPAGKEGEMNLKGYYIVLANGRHVVFNHYHQFQGVFDDYRTAGMFLLACIEIDG